MSVVDFFEGMFDTNFGVFHKVDIVFVSVGGEVVRGKVETIRGGKSFLDRLCCSVINRRIMDSLGFRFGSPVGNQWIWAVATWGADRWIILSGEKCSSIVEACDENEASRI